ncbi:MAG: hypothetical protein JNG88_17130, partial [Phycisphaerales bacterium]|nr:hypothetical protein [Phycisphaerales bacterium]
MAADPFWAVRGPDSAQREPTIGVSATRIVQTTNFTIAVYDQSGMALWSAALDQVVEPPPPATPYFWDGVSNPVPNEYFFDPRVLFDQFSGRFVVMALHHNQRAFVVAFSRDSSPDGPGFEHWDK